MDKLINKTIGKLKLSKISPKPKWRHWFSKYALWFVFGAVVLLCALALGAFSDVLAQIDWDVRGAFRLMPFFWIPVLGGLALGAYWSLRETERGYRYTAWRIIVFVALFLAATSFLVWFGGGGRRLNQNMAGVFPGYGRFANARQVQWSQPENGLLSGTIIEKQSDFLMLKDFSNKQWKIIVDSNTIVFPAAFLEKDSQIKIIGKDKSADEFYAQQIRPWNGMGCQGGGMGMRSGRGNGACSVGN